LSTAITTKPQQIDQSNGLMAGMGSQSTFILHNIMVYTNDFEELKTRRSGE